MFGIHNYAAFVGAIVLFQLMPGPGTVAILHATARGGVGSGMGAVLGTLLGDLVYMTAAASGLAALLVTNPALFPVARWAGIIYLCRFGWNLVRAATDNGAAGTADGTESRRAFRRAFAVALTNPKVVIFFFSFFPLFMEAGSKPGILGVMMAHVTLICLLYQTCLVLVGDRIARRLSCMKHVRLAVRRLAGAALIGFGIRLAFDNN